MALVREIENVVKERQDMHETVRCACSVFTGSDGEKYIQLDTFGTRRREMPDTVSQSLQLSRGSAARLLEIIRSTYPGL